MRHQRVLGVLRHDSPPLRSRLHVTLQKARGTVKWCGCWRRLRENGEPPIERPKKRPRRSSSHIGRPRRPPAARCSHRRRRRRSRRPHRRPHHRSRRRRPRNSAAFQRIGRRSSPVCHVRRARCAPGCPHPATTHPPARPFDLTQQQM